MLDDGSIFFFSVILHIARYGAPGRNLALRKKNVNLVFKVLDPDFSHKHPRLLDALKLPLKSLDREEYSIVCDGIFRDGLSRPIMSVRISTQ